MITYYVPDTMLSSRSISVNKILCFQRADILLENAIKMINKLYIMLRAKHHEAEKQGNGGIESQRGLHLK